MLLSSCYHSVPPPPLKILYETLDTKKKHTFLQFEAACAITIYPIISELLQIIAPIEMFAESDLLQSNCCKVIEINTNHFCLLFFVCCLLIPMPLVEYGVKEKKHLKSCHYKVKHLTTA